MKTVMMECGHTANAQDKDGNPVCVICFGIAPGAMEVKQEQVDLAGRIAKCLYRYNCRNTQPSSLNLAFFEHKPQEDFDGYYCGCEGWD